MRTVARLAVARLAAALLVRALGFFPRGYRREYGEERALVVRMAIEEQAAAGWRPLWRFVGREVRDLPLALVREHWKAWREQMDSSERTVPAERVTGRQYLWFVLPFLIVLIIPLSNLIDSRLWTIIGWPLLALTVVVTIAGLIKGLPRWAVPGLGLALGMANLLLVYPAVFSLPGLGRLKDALWTEGALSGRVLYTLILESARIVPAVVLLLVVALLAAALPARSGLRQRLGQDWTLLPFVLYCANLLTPFVYDAYRGLDATRLLFVVILVAGGWLYLRAALPRVRLAILLAATLLAGVVLGVGIYVIYPAQSFAAGIPLGRQWEALYPLLEALVRMVALVVVAAVAAAVGWRTRRDGRVVLSA